MHTIHLNGGDLSKIQNHQTICDQRILCFIHWAEIFEIFWRPVYYSLKYTELKIIINDVLCIILLFQILLKLHDKECTTQFVIHHVWMDGK